MNIKTQYSVAEEGRKAYRDGKSIYANPYSYGTLYHTWWNKGWEDMKSMGLL